MNNFNDVVTELTYNLTLRYGSKSVSRTYLSIPTEEDRAALLADLLIELPNEV